MGGGGGGVGEVVRHDNGALFSGCFGARPQAGRPQHYHQNGAELTGSQTRLAMRERNVLGARQPSVSAGLGVETRAKLNHTSDMAGRSLRGCARAAEGVRPALVSALWRIGTQVIRKWCSGELDCRTRCGSVVEA
jgi:histidyl-tRNA synthetase